MKFILSGEKTFSSESAAFVWYAVVPAVFMKPEIITNLQTRYITVDTTLGINSGRAVTWTQNDHNDLLSAEAE